jgi:hypothetical protein
MPIDLYKFTKTYDAVEHELNGYFPQAKFYFMGGISLKF